MDAAQVGNLRIVSCVRAVVVMVAALVVIIGVTLMPTSANAEPNEPPPANQDVEGVDPDLVAAVERDLGISWEEYVARSEAAADAAEIQDAPGVDEVRVDGDAVVVTGEGADAEAAAEQVGAELESPSGPSAEDLAALFLQEAGAEVFVSVASSPEGPVLQVSEETEQARTFADEQGIALEVTPRIEQNARIGEYWLDGGGGARCSIGFGGFDSLGRPVMVTAGHCTQDGQLRSAGFLDGPARGTLAFHQFGGPGNTSGELGHDVASYRLDRSDAIAPQATTWPGSLPITGAANLVSGASVCAGGGTTQEWRCTSDTRVGVAHVPGFGENDGRLVQGLQMYGMSTRKGDSGTGIVMGTRVVGVLSGGSGAGERPLAMASGLKPLTDAGYSIGVALEKPTVGGAGADGVVRGTLPRSPGAAALPAATRVSVTIGNASQARAVDSAGRFSFTAPSNQNAVVDIRAASGHSRGPSVQWNSVVGTNTSHRFCGLRDGGCGQHFVGGSVYWATSDSSPVVVLGKIGEGWGRMGWERGWLGYPTGDERCGLVGGGCWQRFQGGRMYWSPATGAHAVRGRIGEAWNQMGYEWGHVGYPVGPEVCGLRNGGCFQRFQGGTIHWSPATGAHLTKGAIASEWGRHSWEKGRLGYPVTSENCGLRQGGCFNHFQNGASIYWTPATGAQPVWGEIRRGWQRQGWERGRWGYPVADERCDHTGGFHCTQRFQGGTVHWDPVRGARLG